MPRTVSRRKRSSGRRRGRAPKPVASKPAVLYARVSSREQEREGYSIAAQQELLRSYARDNDFEILEEFVDVETAKRTGRVQFGRMLKFLKRRHAVKPVVLVEKTDRLYRNLKDWVSLDDTGVDVHLVKEGIVISDDSRSSERFVHGIKVLMAKNYVDNLSEEVRKGMHQKAAEGYWPSSAPFGYVNRREAGRSYIVPDPERAILVRNLFELYDSGQWSVNRLAKYAQEQGFRGKRGGKIQASLIHQILRNPLYAGRFFWGGTLYEGRDPRLITLELFERVQERLDGTPYTRPRELQFAYSGLLTCGHCGAAITAELKKKKYVYYRCAQRCEATAYVREERVREQFVEAMRPMRMAESVRETVKRTLRESRARIEDDVRARVAAAQERIERLGRRESEAVGQTVGQPQEQIGHGALGLDENSGRDVVLDDAVEARQQRHQGRVAPGGGVEGGSERLVGRRRVRVVEQGVRPGRQLVQGERQEHVLPGFEVEIQRALGHAGEAADPGHGKAFEAGLGEVPVRRVEDGAPAGGFLIPGAGAFHVGGGAVHPAHI